MIVTGRSEMVLLSLFQFLTESSETEMRNQFLLREEEDAIFLFVDPDGNMSFFSRIGNEKHCSQVTQFAEFV